MYDCVWKQQSQIDAFAVKCKDLCLPQCEQVTLFSEITQAPVIGRSADDLPQDVLVSSVVNLKCDSLSFDHRRDQKKPATYSKAHTGPPNAIF